MTYTQTLKLRFYFYVKKWLKHLLSCSDKYLAKNTRIIACLNYSKGVVRKCANLITGRVLVPLSLFSHCSKWNPKSITEKDGHGVNNRGWKQWQWQIIAEFIVFPTDLFILTEPYPFYSRLRALFLTRCSIPKFNLLCTTDEREKNGNFKSNYKSSLFIALHTRLTFHLRTTTKSASHQHNPAVSQNIRTR